VGRVVGGSTIEREILFNFNQKKTLSLRLHNPDFTTASRVAEAINTALYEQIAKTPDAGTIQVGISEKYSGNIVGLVALIEGLNVVPDTTSKIVVNERTGTVVMGDNVRISTIAVAHGNLSIQIKESKDVSQPLPFSQGVTVVTPETEISVEEEKNKLLLVGFDCHLPGHQGGRGTAGRIGDNLMPPLIFPSGVPLQSVNKPELLKIDRVQKIGYKIL